MKQPLVTLAKTGPLTPEDAVRKTVNDARLLTTNTITTMLLSYEKGKALTGNNPYGLSEKEAVAALDEGLEGGYAGFAAIGSAGKTVINQALPGTID